MNRSRFNNWLWVISIVGLLFAFGAVLKARRNLQAGHLPSTVTTLLAGLGKSSQLTWCKTRVVELESELGFRVYQENIRWFSETPTKSNLGGVSVEKWLSQFCTVDSKPVALHHSLSAKRALTVHFVQGPAKILSRTSEGYFIWEGQVFQSMGLQKALTQLKEIAFQEK